VGRQWGKQVAEKIKHTAFYGAVGQEQMQ